MQKRSLIGLILGMGLIALAVTSAWGSEDDTLNEIRSTIDAQGADWTAGHTSVSALSDEEQAVLCGTLIETVDSWERRPVPVPRIEVPVYYDWRDVEGDDWTTSIKNQGACGSCWDFSVVGVVESLFDIASGDPTDASDEDFSEQYVLSCCSNCGSCGGGYTGRAFDFIATYGIVTEACLPYEADDSILCGSACGEVPRTIETWSYIPSDVESIKRAIQQFGPVSASFTVHGDFSWYTSGVYRHVWGESRGGHAVVIVGWDDLDQAWICKNSWGGFWGETSEGLSYDDGLGDGGWFRIGWGECGINNNVIVASLAGWPVGNTQIAVLDVNGQPASDVDIYVEGARIGQTALDGTIIVDLLSGLTYSIVAYSHEEGLFLHGKVEGSGELTMNVGAAAHIDVVMNDLAGEPLGAFLVFEWDGWWFTPLQTDDGTGHFYVTPGIYDIHVWSNAWNVGSEKYNLNLVSVDLSASRTLVIDPRTIPTATISLEALPQFDWFEVVMFGEGIGWSRVWRLGAGDRMITSAKPYRLHCGLNIDLAEEGCWSYGFYSTNMTLEMDQVWSLWAGGTLDIDVALTHPTYEPGAAVSIVVSMKDAYDNPIAGISQYQPDSSTGLNVVRIGDDGALHFYDMENLRISPEPRGWSYPRPTVEVRSPNGDVLFLDESNLGESENLALPDDAEFGLYSVRAAQNTHEGELFDLGDFTVGSPCPDPYEPNNTCGSAWPIGNVADTVSSDVAHFGDANEDWYTVTVTVPGLLKVSTETLGDNSDTVIWLYDECAGSLLASNDDFGGLSSYLELPVVPGTYFLKIDQYDSSYGSLTDYRFAVTLLPEPVVTAIGADPITVDVTTGATCEKANILLIENTGQAESELGYQVLLQDVTPVPIPLDPSAVNSRPMVPSVPSTILSAKDTSPLDEWDVVRIDEDEPDAIAGDLRRVDAQIQEGLLYFRLAMYESDLDPVEDLVVDILLDIDQDVETGLGQQDVSFYVGSLGVDNLIRVTPSGSSLYRWSDEGGWLYIAGAAYFSAPPSGNEISFGFQLEQLPIPREIGQGGIDLLTISYTSGGYWDYVPNIGQGMAMYPGGLDWLATTPSNGSLGHGESASLSLTVDASSMLTDQLRLVHLYILSDDMTETIERSIRINIEAPVCDPVMTTLVPSGWTMISLPGELCAPCVWMGDQVYGDLGCALEDDLDPFFAYHYDPDAGSYYRAPPTENICYQPGMSLWIYTSALETIIDADVVLVNEAIEVPLGNGWNQIGNPYAFPINSNSLSIRRDAEVKTLLDAQVAGWIVADLYAYDTSSGNYFEVPLDTGYLPAWAGSWLQTLVDGCTLVFSPYPPPPPPPTAALSGRRLSVREAAVLEIPPPPPAMPMGVVEALASLSARNTPNPVRSEHTTVFKVQGAGAKQVDEIRVDIYSQDGLRVFRERIDDLELVWHTVNNAGELLANGIYLYQVWVRMGEIWYPMEVQKLAVAR